MAKPQPTLNSLAANAASLSQTITSYLSSNGLEAPSFAADSPNYPPAPELQIARLELLTTAADLVHLAMGPSDYALFQPAFASVDTALHDTLNQFDFYSAVPLTGTATYSEIARATTLPESLVRRILRYAMTQRLFAEAGPDRVAHSAATAHVVRDPVARSWLGHYLEENRRGLVELPISLRRFSAGREKPSEEPLEAGLAIADLGGKGPGGKKITFWEYLRENKDKATRFAEAMEVGAKASAFTVEGILQGGFDWEAFGEATVVDVGGSSGRDALTIAEGNPKLKLIVQDLPEAETPFRAAMATAPADVASRVTFQPHDFFAPQPQVADVYFLKMILHDWPDKYAAQIVRNLVPALRGGRSRILLCDVVLPPVEAPVPTAVRRMQYAIDLVMLADFNAKERFMEDWVNMLKLADERLEIKNVAVFPGAVWSLVEVGLRE